MKPSRSPPARPYHHCPLTALVFSSHPIIDTLCAAGCLFPPEGGRLEAWYDQAVSSSLNQMLQILPPPAPPSLAHHVSVFVSSVLYYCPPTSLPPSRIYSMPSRPPVFATSISVTPPHLDLPPPPSVTASNHPHATLPAQAALDAAGDKVSGKARDACLPLLTRLLAPVS